MLCSFTGSAKIRQTGSDNANLFSRCISVYIPFCFVSNFNFKRNTETKSFSLTADIQLYYLFYFFCLFNLLIFNELHLFKFNFPDMLLFCCNATFFIPSKKQSGAFQTLLTISPKNNLLNFPDITLTLLALKERKEGRKMNGSFDLYKLRFPEVKLGPDLTP